jgi:hypothetical protein
MLNDAASERILAGSYVRVCTTTGRIVIAFGAGQHYMPHGLSLGPDGRGLHSSTFQLNLSRFGVLHTSPCPPVS